jgi:hypothetical protein
MLSLMDTDAMDNTTAAEGFPGLYRAILDGIAELERLGWRSEADRIRKASTAAYSGPWGRAGYRRLEQQRLRIERTLATPDHPSPDGRRGRSGGRTPMGALVRRLRPAR